MHLQRVHCVNTAEATIPRIALKSRIARCQEMFRVKFNENIRKIPLNEIFVILRTNFRQSQKVKYLFL